MRVVQPMFVLSAALCAVAGGAQAQTCRGFSSLEKSHMNIGANAWFPSDATSYGGQFHMRHDGMGWEHVVTLGVGTTSYSGAGASGSLNLDGGIGFEKTAKSGLEWCPDLMIGYQTNANGFSDAHNLDLGASVGFGKEMGKMAGFDLAPFGTVGFVHSALSETGFATATDNFWDFGVGLGFRLSSGLQLSPQIEKSSRTNSDVVFGLTVSVPFGK